MEAVNEPSSFNFLNELITGTSNIEDDDFEAFENDLDFINDKITIDESSKLTNIFQEEDDKVPPGPTTPTKETFSGKKVSFDLPDLEEYLSDFESEDDTENTDGKCEEESRIIQEMGTQCSPNIPGASSEKCKSSPRDNQGMKNSQKNLSCCDKCNCRLASVNIFEIPRLDNLFSSIKKNKRKKEKYSHKNTHQKEREEIKVTNYRAVKQGKKSSSQEVAPTSIQKRNGDDYFQKNKCKVKSSSTKKREGLKDLEGKKIIHEKQDFQGKNKFKERKPVDQSWTSSNDSSLLNWLKNKKKEMKQKRLQEKRQKREDIKAKNLASIEDLCKKELSDRKVGEWMKNKKREATLARKKSGSKVGPTDESNQNYKEMQGAAPNGYMVLETFTQTSDCKTEKKDGKENSRTNDRNNLSPSKRSPKKCQKSKKSVGKLSDSDKELNGEKNANDQKIELRKSYDNWVKEKQALLRKEKTENARNLTDNNIEKKIAVDERKRRYKVKQDLKIKVDSKWEKKRDTGLKDLCEQDHVPSKSSTEFGVRPEPQGCDHMSSKTTDLNENILDSATCISEKTTKAADVGKQCAGNDETKPQSAIQYLSDNSDRIWMKGLQNSQMSMGAQSQDQHAAKPQRPKTAKHKPLINNLFESENKT